MITNRMQLLQAAQKHAAEFITTIEPLAILELKAEAFKALGVARDHWPEFSTAVNGARMAYASLTAIPVKPQPALVDPVIAAVPEPAPAPAPTADQVSAAPTAPVATS